MSYWLVSALSVVGFVLVGLTLSRVYFAWLHRNHHEADASDEIHFVRTEDGARLALYRYRPKGDQRRREPVFFVHGLGANKYNLDFDEAYSWARGFARAGFDAWIVDLRGAGMSVPPKPDWNWNFDDYARQDVTAAVAHIRQATGAERVHWVGHSMGGMLLYSYLGIGKPEWIRSGVAMGSPVRFASRHGLGAALKLAFLLDHIKYVPIRTAIHLALPLIPLIRNSAPVRSQMNPDNIDLGFIQRVAYNAVHHLPPALLKQFSDWVVNDCFRSADHQVDYQAALRESTVPVFVISGAGDILVQPVNAKHAYDLMPDSSGKQYLEVGRATGFGHDYGHIDFVFGRDAAKELFPRVLEWVIAHDSGSAQAPEAPVVTA